MDSVKSFKGYGKVDESENLAFKRKARRRILIITISTITLLSIIIALSISLTLNRNPDKSPNPAPSFSNSIKAMCGLTQYPDSCFTSISSVNGANSTSDPEQIFKLSLLVASHALQSLASFPDSIAIPTNDARLKRAISDCSDMFQEAIDRVQDSISLITPKGTNEKMLTIPKINDVRTWLSAAMTNQESCLDGFEGTTGEEKLRERFESAMKNSSEFVSNSLAIVTGMQGVLRDLNFEMHRKLLSCDGPEWVVKGRRELLQEGNELVPNVTVAKDGSGQVSTISDAVLMIPKKSLERFVIQVKKGVYEENVVLDKSKWNVVIYGDGMYETTVTGSLNFVDGTPTFSTATFAVAGRGFMARDIGFKNTAGPTKHQAVAFRSGSDHSIFHRCYFEGYQDTLYAHSNRQFYRECVITGTIDFIFGNGAAVFQKCTITPLQPLPNQKNIITAQGRKDLNENTGIVIQGCTVSASGDVSAPTFLGRPWKDFSTTVFMQTDIGSVVDASGWLSWVAGTDPPDTIYYAEFQNTGPGAGTAGRVKWAGYNPAISAEEAARYTVHAFLEGTEWIRQAGVLFDSTL